MVDIAALTEWDKLGICTMHPTWHSAHYFKAPYSLRKLIEMGLIEEKMSEPSGQPFDRVPARLLQLTAEGLKAKEEILASGFNPMADIRRRA